MYIDQLNDSDAPHVSDLKEVNKYLCQRLNQTARNIEECLRWCHSATLSDSV